MKARIYVHSSDRDASLLLEMSRPPAEGDLLDTERWGPCEVVDVLRTPKDRCQDALVFIRISNRVEVQG
jgi:hypothetical protein